MGADAEKRMGRQIQKTVCGKRVVCRSSEKVGVQKKYGRHFLYLDLQDKGKDFLNCWQMLNHT